MEQEEVHIVLIPCPSVELGLCDTLDNYTLRRPMANSAHYKFIQHQGQQCMRKYSISLLFLEHNFYEIVTNTA